MCNCFDTGIDDSFSDILNTSACARDWVWKLAFCLILMDIDEKVYFWMSLK